MTIESFFLTTSFLVIGFFARVLQKKCADYYEKEDAADRLFEEEYPAGKCPHCGSKWNISGQCSECLTSGPAEGLTRDEYRRYKKTFKVVLWSSDCSGLLFLC